MSLDQELGDLVREAVREGVRAELEALTTRPLTVTVGEAAELLGVSRRTVDRWLADGLLRRMPHTTRALIPRQALDEFVMGEGGSGGG